MTELSIYAIHLDLRERENERQNRKEGRRRKIADPPASTEPAAPSGPEGSPERNSSEILGKGEERMKYIFQVYQEDHVQRQQQKREVEKRKRGFLATEGSERFPE